MLAVWLSCHSATAALNADEPSLIPHSMKKSRVKSQLSPLDRLQFLQKHSTMFPRTHVPIDTLPNELLVAIFVHNADRTLFSFLATLTTSHVCSHWRTIALNCPQLWRSFAFLHTPNGPPTQEFTLTMLERCGDLTLDVGWERVPGFYNSGSQVDRYASLSFECGYIHRFRSYHLFVSPILIELTRAYFTQPASLTNMEELKMDTGFFYRIFPHTTFDGKTCSLKFVTLRTCWMDLTWFNMSNLQSLDVTHAPHIHPWAFYQWVTFLRGCPNLRLLRLVLPGLDQAYTPEGNVSQYLQITLPHLTDLYLEVPLEVSRRFMSQLTLPSVQHISLASRCPYQGPPGSTQIQLYGLDQLTQHIVNEIAVRSISPIANQMKIHVSRDDVCVRFSSPSKAHPRSLDHLEIKVTFNSEPDAMTVLSHILRGWYPVASSIISLHANIPPGDAGLADPIEQFLRRTTSLTGLIHPSPSFFSIISDVDKRLKSSASEQSNELQVLVPTLEKLIYNGPSVLFDLSNEFAEMRAFILHTQKMGYPIKKFEAPSATRPLVQSLLRECEIEFCDSNNHL